MAKPGLGFRIWTAGLSVFVAVMLYPNIVGKHGVYKSVVITALAVGAIWMIYFVIGRVISRAVSEELKRKSREKQEKKLRCLPIILAATGCLTLLIACTVEGCSKDRSGPLLEVREKIVGLIEEKKAPSLSLAVVKNGEIIWEESFGLANLEKRLKATPETLYPIASATKPFTATALMILVERGSRVDHRVRLGKAIRGIHLK